MKNTAATKRVVISVVIVVAWVALASITAPRRVSATTRTVTTLSDYVAGSLRQTIIEAASGDTIDFSDTLDFSVHRTITLTSGELLIDKNLIITGPGAAKLTIAGFYPQNPYSRIFEVAAGVTATISDLRLADGRVDNDNGGAILNRGSVTLTNCDLTGNAATNGAGIFNDSGATAMITNCTLPSNNANLGAGIFNQLGGTLTITGSTVSGSLALNGAGILNSGTATITDSTVSGNQVRFTGAGIFNDGTMMITGSTVANNFVQVVTAADGRGGGIENSGAMTITNTTVSGNYVSGNNLKLGGGISNESGATATITGSTIAYNYNTLGSPGLGGGIHNNGTVTLFNSTLAQNSCLYGPGLYSGGTVNVINSTIYFNTSPEQPFGIVSTGPTNIKNSIAALCPLNHGASFIASGVNFSTDNTYPGFTVVPLSGVGGLNLGPLQDNFGPTQTLELLSGSVAIDAVTDCTDLALDRVFTDQRGINRPIDGDGSGTPQCDAGSYEAAHCTTDLTPPQIGPCPANITQALPPDQCSAVVSYTKPTASGNCPLNPVVCAPASGSMFPKGDTTVTCRVRDFKGLSANCQFTVTVLDDAAPVFAGCTNLMANTDPNMCTAVVNFTGLTATDNCDGARPVNCNPASGTAFAKGVTTVMCTASDTAQPPHTANCSFTVTVSDAPPSITCPASGGAFSASDCLPSDRLAYQAATYYSAGSNTVTTAVLRGFSTCTAPPVSGVSTINFNATFVGDYSTGGPATRVQAPATGSMRVTFNNQSGSTRTFDTEMLQLDLSGGTLPPNTRLRESPTLASTGQTTITTVTGGFHIDSFFDIFVDLSTDGGGTWTPGSSSNRVNAVQATDSNQCTAVVNYPSPAVSDNCSGVGNPSCNPASGTTFAKGTTTVMCSVQDASMNSSSCSFTVTVVDTEAPSMTCPANINVTANTPQNINYTTPTPTDHCPGVGASCSPASGTSFAVGTTTVTCSASDAMGNQQSCSFTVSVIPCAITCPANQMVNNTPGQCGANVNYPAPMTTGQCGTVTCTPAAGSSFAKGTTTVSCSTTTGPSCMFTVTVKDNEAPTFAGCANRTVSTALNQCQAVVNYTGLSTTDNCDGARPVVCNPASGSTFPKGTTTVSCTATDTSGNTEQCTFTVTVTDTLPPSITCPANITTSTDGNQCSALVSFTPAVSDNCSGVGASCLPPSGAVFPIGTTSVNCIATDASGNAASCSFTVTVNNPSPVASISGPPSGAIYAAGAAVSFAGSFTDNAGDVHTAEWSFTSNSQSVTQTGAVNESTGAVSASRAFTEAGVYLVTLTVRDQCGNTGSANTVSPDGLTAMVVIYDADGGFVTGGGWINSPAGAYGADPALTGKASFGFVSKYQHGASVPTGDTEFQFRAASFNFKSSAYDWLVIAGARAQYKGTGTINGGGNYGFMLTAIDGQINGGGGTDKFRIKIWNKSNGDALVYDNQFSAPDGADPTTLLGGGSIVIHQ